MEGPMMQGGQQGRGRGQGQGGPMGGQMMRRQGPPQGGPMGFAPDQNNPEMGEGYAFNRNQQQGDNSQGFQPGQGRRFQGRFGNRQGQGEGFMPPPRRQDNDQQQGFAPQGDGGFDGSNNQSEQAPPQPQFDN